MTAFLFQLCVVHRCSSLLLATVVHDCRHHHAPNRLLTPVAHRALVARAVAATRLRRRRASRAAPATHLHKRRRSLGFHSLTQKRQQLSKSPDLDLDSKSPVMASQQEIRRRSSIADRSPPGFGLPAHASTWNLSSSSSGAARQDSGKPDSGAMDHHQQQQKQQDDEAPPPLPARSNSMGFKGHSRSKSLACRQVNRLSLTLPIAPPTSDPSRPTPTSSTMSSIPPTPIDSTSSPSDANEFIIAIAAQERRVLELREELIRAEKELHVLKKKWSHKEAASKRADARSHGSAHPSPVIPSDDENGATRRSVDHDRRKMLLQKETQAQTPTQTPTGLSRNPSRRRVIRGGHTRTLSLLSPVKTEDGFPVSETEPVKLPTIERRTAQLTNPNLSKRASWQPRSQQSVAGVPQIVEDFKLGLRAFVEDIRQITVGDEPISGQQQQQPTRSTAVDYRNGASRETPSPGNQDTIRASHAARPKVSTVFDSPKTATSTPTPSSKTEEAAPREKDKAKPSKSKHFSWTPLGFDAIDDNDWSNWESPSSSSVKTSRWSGSTMGSSGIEDMDNALEAEEQNNTPSKKKSALIDAPILSPRLEEILPNMVNRLSPSNIKRTATNLMDEWEKSLVDPQPRAKEQNKENTTV